MTATSTASTRPSSIRLRKSEPPPNSQTSLPGLALSAAMVSAGRSETVTPGQSAGRSVREKT